MIKKFKEFTEKDEETHKYGCVMLYPKMDDWEKIISTIDPNDIYANKGLEIEPHITLLYGLHQGTEEKVNDIINKYEGKNINITINGIGKFDNDKFSVVKFNIESPILYKINKELSTLPHTTDFPNYTPHMTISYVKPGYADKYLSNNYRKNLTANRIVYQTTEGKNIEYLL